MSVRFGSFLVFKLFLVLFLQFYWVGYSLAILCGYECFGNVCYAPFEEGGAYCFAHVGQYVDLYVRIPHTCGT